MAEQTFTATEVAEIIGMIADALDAGGQIMQTMVKVQPGLSAGARKFAADMFTLYADENVAHIRGIIDVIKNS